jgi:magnesium-transporting ATPase (P-type)
MITGDHRLTSLAIARQLDVAHDDTDVITGRELADLSPERFAASVGTARVFARVTPRQKLQIVEAARAAGHFVAVTGDGVNDAPALRAANLGVAMGKGGTDVAREAAGLVISDDNFATIVAGIEEGRIAYDNVRKVIFLLVSTGAAEMVLVTLAVATGLNISIDTASRENSFRSGRRILTDPSFDGRRVVALPGTPAAAGAGRRPGLANDGTDRQRRL